MVVHMDGCHVQRSCWTFTCCLPPIAIDGQFLRHCKQGTLQFVILKPILAAAALILHSHGGLAEGELRADRGYVWILLVYNLSYSAALMALLLFYLGAKDLLKPFNPLLKFVLVKSVVFLTFWQGMGCTIAVNLGYIDNPEHGRILQNFMICIEMALASILMNFAFPFWDYKTPDGLDHRGISGSIEHAISIHDVMNDVEHQFAPSYHDYILYSDGTDEGPRRHRTRTFVLLGREMNFFSQSKNKSNMTSDRDALTDKPHFHSTEGMQVEALPTDNSPTAQPSISQGDVDVDVQLDVEDSSTSTPGAASNSSQSEHVNSEDPVPTSRPPMTSVSSHPPASQASLLSPTTTGLPPSGSTGSRSSPAIPSLLRRNAEDNSQEKHLD